MILAIALGLALAQPPDEQVVAEAALLAQVNAELDVGEQAGFDRFRSGLTADQQNALMDVTSRLPVGARGVFIAKLLEAQPDQQAGMTRFMAVLTPAQRLELAQNLAGRSPPLWDALFRYVAIVPAREAAAVIFDPTSIRTVDVSKDANVNAAQEFEQDWYPPQEMSGATAAPPHSAPWQVQIYKAGASASPLSPRELRQELVNYGVMLEDFQRWHECGGVLLDQGWVLTAAHCIKTPRLGPFVETRRIRTGTDSIAEGGTTWRIAAVVKHGGYDPQSKRNDIALIKIAPDGQTDLARNRAAKAILLATRSHTLRTGERLIATGWGVTGETDIGGRHLDRFGFANLPSPILMQVVVLNQPLSRCNDDPNYRKVGATVALGQICALGDDNADACQGDSGGPLVLSRKNRKTILVGLVSFGPGCGLEDTPGAYADVRYYKEWIEGAMKQARPNAVIDWPPRR